MRLTPFSPLYRRAPADTWRQLLAGGDRVGYDTDLGIWVIVGHAPVRLILHDAQQFSSGDTLTPIRALSGDVRAALAAFDAPAVAVSADAPTHTRTRAVIRSLMPHTADAALQRWGGTVRYRVDQLVNQVAANDPTTSVDLVEQFSRKLPLLVLLDIIGVPVRNAPRICTWTRMFTELMWGDATPQAQLYATQGITALWTYCRHLTTRRIAARTSEHTDDLVSRLLRYRAGDDTRLTVDEVAAIVLNLLVVGCDTTTALIGHALEHGLRDPARWARLGTEASYASDHVEETLRLSPAIDGWLRTTTTSVTLDDVTIPAGSRCLLLIGTANHDPAVFTNPERFDPDRAWLTHHLSFGAGAHDCPGAALARLQATTAVTVLAQRLPELRLAPDYQPLYQVNAAICSPLAVPASPGAGGCPVMRIAAPAGRL